MAPDEQGGLDELFSLTFGIARTLGMMEVLAWCNHPNDSHALRANSIAFDHVKAFVQSSTPKPGPSYIYPESLTRTVEPHSLHVQAVVKALIRTQAVRDWRGNADKVMPDLRFRHRE